MESEEKPTLASLGITDGYGCVVPGEPTWDYISQRLSEKIPVIFSYMTRGREHTYTISIIPRFEKIGKLSFGGELEDTWLVSLIHFGTFLFNFNSKIEIPESFVTHKLNLPVDSGPISELLNELRKRCYKKFH